ncbi:MAG: sugar phosphate nucleotidyltransferase [Candidatus Omnitrophota bacterium]|nr:sugar phosphate nucleotidyltransferase [Candidatus Omnitrophota bacterium]
MNQGNKDNYVVLLAGGSGSRFWPQARVLEPKQFLTLHKNKSLFEKTILRIKPIILSQNIFIATSCLYQNQVLEIIKNYKIPLTNVIFESLPQNTGPSICLAAMFINKINPNAKAAFLPCDHLITNTGVFQKMLRSALAGCADKIALFGICPTHPATGYGYIKTLAGRGPILKVAGFCEKPDFKTAQRFLKTKGYFWNSGIFVSLARTIIEEFKHYLPGTYKELEKIVTVQRSEVNQGVIPAQVGIQRGYDRMDSRFHGYDKNGRREFPEAELLQKIKNPQEINKYWKNIKPISFDYGIIEKTGLLVCLKSPKNLGWSDLGSWESWDKLVPKDNSGNKFFGQAIDLKSRNITVFGSAKRIIATIGLNDLIVVDTPDALLITKKGLSEEVKKIVEILKKRQRQEHYLHKTVKRKWGCYTVLDAAKGFKIKIIEIKPKHFISLQYHKKRSEHWVVVEGAALVQKGKRVWKVSSNESTYIPASCIHRISNPGDSILKIVEVQTGNYLEEDDIVRLVEDSSNSSAPGSL